MEISIRPAREGDAADIVGIYNTYVSGTCITFETEPVHAPEMAQRIADTAASSLPWLVAVASDRVIGYAYASKWRGRSAYRFSVESTVYLDPAHTGKGLGFRLYAALIDAIRGEQSAILHIRQVAHFEQVGYKQDRWVDVGYWQLLLEA